MPIRLLTRAVESEGSGSRRLPLHRRLCIRPVEQGKDHLLRLLASAIRRGRQRIGLSLFHSAQVAAVRDIESVSVGDDLLSLSHPPAAIAIAHGRWLGRASASVVTGWRERVCV